MSDWVELYLVAESEEVLRAALPQCCEDGAWTLATRDYSLVLPGPRMTGPARTNKETGRVTRRPVFDPNFHLNMRCTPAFAETVPQQYRVEPQTPTVRWA